MKVWTHHPSEFRIDQPGIKIDPTKGSYWRKCAKGFRYTEVLPMLQQRVGTSQLLWCCTLRGQYMPVSEPSDRVEWEVKLSLSEVTLISVPIWEDIVWNRSDDWDSLILTDLSESDVASKEINALAFLPLPEGCLTCHGQLPPRYLMGSKPNPAYREYLERNGFDYFKFHSR